MPELTPTESSLYLYLLRNSLLKDGSCQVRIGKRTMADGYGTGSRGAKTNYGHITEVIKRLEDHGCLSIGDTTREGTLYTVILPRDVPMVREKIASLDPHDEQEDSSLTRPSDLSSSSVTTGSVSIAGRRSQRRMPHLTTTSRNPKGGHTPKPICGRAVWPVMASSLASPLTKPHPRS